MLDFWERKARLLKRSEAWARERRIERRYNPNSIWTPARQVLKEMRELIAHRHGGPCDTDDGEAYLRAALPWVIDTAGGFDTEDLHAFVGSWAGKVIPRVDEKTILSGIVKARYRHQRKHLWWSAQRLGDLLRLTVAEREHLRITRIRPAGMTSRQFAAYRRRRKAARAKALRAADGATPREQSAARLVPWKALSVSRATYYRMKSKGELPGQLRDRETNSSRPGTKYLQSVVVQSHRSEPTVPGPASEVDGAHGVGADGPSPRAKSRAIPTGRARALPLPEGGIFEHRDLLGDPEGWRQLGASLTAYEVGVLPPELVRVVREVQRVRLLSQNSLAAQIGVSRPQLTNALLGRFGLSRSAAVNLMAWLTAGT